METDVEQVEKLKQWWQENGRSVIAGVVIGVGGLFGYRYWVDYQTEIAEQASQNFHQILEALDADDKGQARTEARLLVTHYADSEYAIMAGLILAKLAVEDGDYEKASAALQQMIVNFDTQPLIYVAQQRLASIQIQRDEPEAALETLMADFPAEFSARVEELKGDAYAQLGRTSEAAAAYRAALSAAPVNAVFLQQKLDDLGVAG